MSIYIDVISRHKAPSGNWKIILAVALSIFIGYATANLIGDEVPVEEIPVEWPDIAFGD